MDKQINVAIAGLGVIGSGVATVLLQHQQQGSALKLGKILEINPQGKYAAPLHQQHPDLFTQEINEVVANDQIDVVVETIGGRGFAKTLIEQALSQGKHVVTANKDLMATHGRELSELAAKNQVKLLCEASVGGAIPIIHLLRTFITRKDVTRLIGILNGTTNYILTEMELNQLSFETALKQAQELGFAEQDPTNDIEGYDARYKLVILTWLITGQWLQVDQISVQGISNLEPADFEYASDQNKRIKMLAVLDRGEQGMKAFVMPIMLPMDHPVAKVDGSTNIVTLTGKYSDDISVIGKGAGSLPTASAIVSDLGQLAQPTPEAETLEGSSAEPLLDFGQCTFQHMLRFKAHDTTGMVGQIGNILATHDISIYSLQQLPQYHMIDGQNKLIFTVMLEPCQESKVRQAVEELNRLEFLESEVRVLRAINTEGSL